MVLFVVDWLLRYSLCSSYKSDVILGQSVDITLFMRDLRNVIKILVQFHSIKSKFGAVLAFLSSEKWSSLQYWLEAPLLVPAVVDSIEVVNELFER